MVCVIWELMFGRRICSFLSQFTEAVVTVGMYSCSMGSGTIQIASVFSKGFASIGLDLLSQGQSFGRQWSWSQGRSPYRFHWQPCCTWQWWKLEGQEHIRIRGQHHFWAINILPVVVLGSLLFLHKFSSSIHIVYRIRELELELEYSYFWATTDSNRWLLILLSLTHSA